MKKIILLLFIASSLHVFAQSGEEKTDEKKDLKRKDYLQAEALMQDFRATQPYWELRHSLATA